MKPYQKAFWIFASILWLCWLLRVEWKTDHVQAAQQQASDTKPGSIVIYDDKKMHITLKTWIESHCVAVMPDQQIGGTLRLRCEEPR